ncbi:MAG TPA: protein kinase [Micromonosporaceae bacterium]|jgi:serine/threonine protein kinase
MNAPLLPALPGYDDPELIAHGTTALVFRATQTRLNRPVAIKVITADPGSGSVPVNVERELATTVALSSQPHIVSIIDTGVTEDDRRYIVMEYCEGGSYAQILRQHGPLPVEDVVEVGIKIGQALHAAHQAGIVHRDVKPSNLLRSRFGPALTDFGIARAPDELGSTLTREMMTPHHASPEALLHQAQSGLSDVYSLASTMWTLLVGRPPYVDRAHPDMDMYTFRDRVLHDPLPAMEREDVPEWLVAELHRAMAKLPALRHGTALEFSEGLQRGSLGLAAPPPAPEQRTVIARPVVPLTEAPVPAPDPPQPADTERPPRIVPALSLATAPIPVVPPPAAADPVVAPPGGEPGPIYRPRRTVPASASGPPVHPLSEVQADVTPAPAIEERGWLGSPDVTTGPWPATAVEPIPERPGRRSGVSSAGRGRLVAVLAGVAALAVLTVLVLFLHSRAEPAPPQAGPSGSPQASATTVAITAGTAGAPTDLRIEDDRGTSVTIAWTDPTGGTQSYVAVRLGPGPDDVLSQTVPPGGAMKTATFTDLAKDTNYCFRVGLVRSASDIAVTPVVCTTR